MRRWRGRGLAGVEGLPKYMFSCIQPRFSLSCLSPCRLPASPSSHSNSMLPMAPFQDANLSHGGIKSVHLHGRGRRVVVYARGHREARGSRCVSAGPLASDCVNLRRVQRLLKPTRTLRPRIMFTKKIKSRSVRV